MIDVEGGPVVPWAQAWADKVNELTGIKHIMTYDGHQPDQQHALDIFVTREQGDLISQYAKDNIEYYSIDYIIWRQHIYNPEINDTWRLMEDRGDNTANHFDHCHFSFEPTGNAQPNQEDDMGLPEQKMLAEIQNAIMGPTDGIIHRLEVGELNDQATNEAVGRLEVAVRDSQGGLGVKLDNLSAHIAELTATLKANKT